MNTEQKLGIRVFYYYLSKRIIIGIVLFIVACIVLSSKNVVSSVINFVLPLNIVSSLVYYLTLGLFVVSILFVVGALLMSWIDYISCTFTLNDASFNIKRGILNKKEVSIPYRQIQDIDIEQTFYNRLMGVSKLVILTAGNDSDDKKGESEGIFEVIDSSIAEKIRNNILQKTNIQTVREVKNS